jgi:hypothetical protein
MRLFGSIGFRVGRAIPHPDPAGPMKLMRKLTARDCSPQNPNIKPASALTKKILSRLVRPGPAAEVMGRRQANARGDR